MSLDQTRRERALDPMGRSATGPETFLALMGEKLPGASVVADPPLQEDGEWWFDISLDGFEGPVSWLARRGFGLYLGEPGYGELPSETYLDPKHVARRIAQLASDGPRSPETSSMVVGQVRKLLGQTQESLARLMDVKQANVSRLENRANPTLGSMRALVEAMGGTLEVRAKFPGVDVPIALPAPEAEA